jgi:hypothetical protein
LAGRVLLCLVTTSTAAFWASLVREAGLSQRSRDARICTPNRDGKRDTGGIK